MRNKATVDMAMDIDFEELSVSEWEKVCQTAAKVPRLDPDIVEVNDDEERYRSEQGKRPIHVGHCRECDRDDI